MELPVSAFNLGPGAQSIFLEIMTLTSWRGVGQRLPSSTGVCGVHSPPCDFKAAAVKECYRDGRGRETPEMMVGFLILPKAHSNQLCQLEP